MEAVVHLAVVLFLTIAILISVVVAEFWQEVVVDLVVVPLLTAIQLKFVVIVEYIHEEVVHIVVGLHLTTVILKYAAMVECCQEAAARLAVGLDLTIVILKYAVAIAMVGYFLEGLLHMHHVVGILLVTGTLLMIGKLTFAAMEKLVYEVTVNLAVPISFMIGKLTCVVEGL